MRMVRVGFDRDIQAVIGWPRDGHVFGCERPHAGLGPVLRGVRSGAAARREN
jgi:hypothetical protein